MNKHIDKCRKNDSSYVVVKVDDQYRCDICDQLFRSMFLFKRHVFVRHSDLEVRVKYKRSLENLIGDYHLSRFREPLFNQVKSGCINHMIQTLLSTKQPFDIDSSTPSRGTYPSTWTWTGSTPRSASPSFYKPETSF